MSQTKFLRAYSFIASAIDKGDFLDSRFFPSAASLADLAGVSASTVLKAIRRIKKEGRLAGGRWKRASLPGRLPASPPPTPVRQLPARRTKCLAIQTRIIRDILNGRYRSDAPLPSEKELAVTYGVSPWTLHKALLALVEQSQLDRRGTKFFLESISRRPGHAQPRIILFGQGSNMGANILWGDWHREYFKLLEQECVRSRLALDVVCFVREESGLRLINGRNWSPWTLDMASEVEGFICEVTGANCFEDSLLQSLAMTGRPVAILDEVGEWPSPAFLKRHSNVRVFRNTISSRPGQQVARRVLESGHREAVFVSPYHHLAYSQLRYQSIAREFSVVDGARITPIVHEGEPGAGPEADAERSRGDELMRNYAGWVRRFPDSHRDGLDRDLDRVSASLEAGRVRRVLYRLCQQALTIKTATVWITVNDFCAFWTNAFLDRLKIGVPGGGISIISFDDDPEFLDKHITSYNFNKAGMIGAMLRYIRYPRLFPAAKPVIEIEGYIVPRATLGRR